MDNTSKNAVIKEKITERKRIERNLWKKAHNALTCLYGDMPNVRILNRFYSEKMLFENGDYIMMWDLVAELRLRAREIFSRTVSSSIRW